MRITKILVNLILILTCLFVSKSVFADDYEFKELFTLDNWQYGDYWSADANGNIYVVRNGEHKYYQYNEMGKIVNECNLPDANEYYLMVDDEGNVIIPNREGVCFFVNCEISSIFSIRFKAGSRYIFFDNGRYSSYRSDGSVVNNVVVISATPAPEKHPISELMTYRMERYQKDPKLRYTYKRFRKNSKLMYFPEYPDWDMTRLASNDEDGNIYLFYRSVPPNGLLAKDDPAFVQKYRLVKTDDELKNVKYVFDDIEEYRIIRTTQDVYATRMIVKDSENYIIILLRWTKK